MKKTESQIVVDFPQTSKPILAETYRDKDKVVFATVRDVDRRCLATISQISIGDGFDQRWSTEVSFPESLDLEAVKDVAISVSKDGVLLQGNRKRPIQRFKSASGLVDDPGRMATGAVRLVEDSMTYPEGKDARWQGVEAIKRGVVVEITFLFKEVEGYEELEKIVLHRRMTAKKAGRIVGEWFQNLGNWMGGAKWGEERKGKKS